MSEDDNLSKNQPGLGLWEHIKIAMLRKNKARQLRKEHTERLQKKKALLEKKAKKQKQKKSSL